MDISFKENKLTIFARSIGLSHEIRQIEVIENKIIVLLSIPQNDTTIDNIYAVSTLADILWRVVSVSVKYSKLPYEQIVIHGGEICATDFNGRRVFISVNTGEIIKRDIVK